MTLALRLATIVGLAALLPGCGAFLSFDDGIPFDGTSSMFVIDDGEMRQVLAFGESGSGFRLEWTGRQSPVLRADDKDLLLAGAGVLLLSEHVHGSEVAELRIEQDGHGETRRFTRDGEERPFEPEGAAWLGRAIPALIDHFGLGARTRVPRLLAEGGLDAVLEDILGRATDLARNEDYEALLGQPGLSSADVARAIGQASTQIESDAHLADLLEETIEARPGDDAVLGAILAAAASIESDAHLADLLETVVEQGGVRGQQLDRVLDLAGTGLDSDAHLADVLDTVTAGDLSDVSATSLVAALAQIESDAHAAAVLEDLVGRQGLRLPVLALLLAEVGPRIGSDAHLADVLQDVPASALGDDEVRRGFLTALATVEADSHAAAVLEDLVEQTEDPRVLADLVQAAGDGIGSDAHLAAVLTDVPVSALDDPTAREALRAAVATLESSAHRESVLRRFPAGALDG